MKKLFLSIVLVLFLASSALAGQITFNVVIHNMQYSDRAVWVTRINNLPADYIVDNVTYTQNTDEIFGDKGQMTFAVTKNNTAESDIPSVKTAIVNFCSGYYVTINGFRFTEEGL